MENRIGNQSILDEFFKLKNIDALDTENVSYVVNVVDKKVISGMCLYPYGGQNPLTPTFRKFRFKPREVQSFDRLWIASDFFYDNSLDKCQMQISMVNLVKGIIEYALKESIETVFFKSNDENRKIFLDLGLPLHIVYPRLPIPDNAPVMIGRLDVSWTIIRFLEKKLFEGIFDDDYHC